VKYSKTLLLGWLLVLVGCSGSDAGGSTPVPIEQFPQQYSAALCEAIAPCCKDAALPHTPTACKTKATQYFTSVVTAESGPNNKYDAAAAGECLSQVKSAFANCQQPTPQAARACYRLFVGTLPPGASCSLSRRECANGNCQPPADGSSSSTGVCVAYQTAQATIAEGGPCEPAFSRCAAGLYCPYETGVCTKAIPVGGSCTDDSYSCKEGAFCSVSGVCTAQYDSGPCGGTESQEACSDKSYCSSDLFASSAAGQCLKKKPDGYACANSRECLQGVCNGTTCGPEAAESTASCGGEFRLPGMLY